MSCSRRRGEAAAVWRSRRRGICLDQGQQLSGGGLNHATTAVRYRHAPIGQIQRALIACIELVEDHIQIDIENDIQDRVEADRAPVRR